MGCLARAAFSEAAMRTAAQFSDYDPTNPLAMSPAQGAFYMSVVSEKLMGFDKETLMPFYRRIQKAVERASHKPLITGGNIYSSSTVSTGIERLDERGNQIYAPHGYDAVVDSDRYESFNKTNVEALFADKRRSQQRMNLPVIIGEWGAFPSKTFTNELIRHMNGILEQYLWSSTYWQWMPGLEIDENYAALSRAFPVSTAGDLRAYHYDAEMKALSLCYAAKENGVTTVYCPFRPAKVEGSATISFTFEPITEAVGFLRLKSKEPGEVKLTIS